MIPSRLRKILCWDPTFSVWPSLSPVSQSAPTAAPESRHSKKLSPKGQLLIHRPRLCRTQWLGQHWFFSAQVCTIEAIVADVSGIPNIPRRISLVLLLASGREKADILHKALTGPITPLVPASILQLHANLVVIGDREALSAFEL